MSVAADRDQAFLDAVRRIADEVAAAARRRRRPRGALPGRDASTPLREAGALAALRARVELGGGGVELRDDRRGVLRARPPLRRERDGLRDAPDPGRDASSRHATARRGFEDYLRELAAEQRLIASVTSEVGTGGDMGRSIAAVDSGRATAVCSFEKQAPTVSYGAHADDLLDDAAPQRRRRAERPGPRRSPARTRPSSSRPAPGTRSACAARARPASWCSADVRAEQVLPDAVRRRSPPQSMVPVSHILWSHLWLGHRDRRVRSRARLRPRGGQAQAREPLPAGAAPVPR